MRSAPKTRVALTISEPLSAGQIGVSTFGRKMQSAGQCVGGFERVMRIGVLQMTSCLAVRQTTTKRKHAFLARGQDLCWSYRATPGTARANKAS